MSAHIKYFTYFIIAIVAAAIIAGFFIVGSPLEGRVRRFDERRVSDLQFLQEEIKNYWMNKQKLPENLSLLRDDIRGVSIPKDPETGTEYEYNILGETKFALCASFSRPTETYGAPTQKSVPAEPYVGIENWEHKEGRVCFERTIDPDIYRPKTKGIPAQD